MTATDTTQQGQAPNPDVAQANGVFHIHDLIMALLAAERANVIQVSVGNFDRREVSLLDFPPGMGGHTKRLIVPRYGLGGVVLVATTVTEILEQNEGRLGGQIVNSGGFPVRLYLTTPGDIGGAGNALSNQAPNRPSVWLAANGGAWDFRLGHMTYGGTVCAVGIGGASQVDAAEF